jgi:hypothetical protein
MKELGIDSEKMLKRRKLAKRLKLKEENQQNF